MEKILSGLIIIVVFRSGSSKLNIKCKVHRKINMLFRCPDAVPAVHVKTQLKPLINRKEVGPTKPIPGSVPLEKTQRLGYF
jgi:hypothetical protein